jgi:hypothetical protein
LSSEVLLEKLILVLMINPRHTNSIEFDFAENVWLSARGVDDKLKAVAYYKIACEKNDARAFLALFKISNSADKGALTPHQLRVGYNLLRDLWGGLPGWEELLQEQRQMITGEIKSALIAKGLLLCQDFGNEVSLALGNCDEYLGKALDLGYLPAFIYASDCYSQTFLKLLYLSVGLAIAQRENDPLLEDFQKRFSRWGDGFEFSYEILRLGESWEPSKSIENLGSKLFDNVIDHPNKYNPEKDGHRLHWVIFPVRKNIEEYLKQLPGNHEYVLSYKAEDEGDLSNFRRLMELSAQKGHGQAKYYLNSIIYSLERVRDLVDAAENGSPDAFSDLINRLLRFPEGFKFFNTAKLHPATKEKSLVIIDCVVYLYSLMERLGIENYESVEIYVTYLSSDTESGYREGSFSGDVLKYQLCDHSHIMSINDRAYSWNLGSRFDAKFYDQLHFLGFDLDEIFSSS